MPFITQFCILKFSFAGQKVARAMKTPVKWRRKGDSNKLEPVPKLRHRFWFPAKSAKSGDRLSQADKIMPARPFQNRAADSLRLRFGANPQRTMAETIAR
jgi:hypothetical protein